MEKAAELDVFSRHGGRIAAARAAFPAAPQPWLDLSTGINPRPYPAPRASLEDRGRLPDPEALRRLEHLAAEAFGAAPHRVAAVAGSETAIRLLPNLLGVSSVAITPDTYGGHAEAWRAAGVQVQTEPSTAEAWVVVNPNNPDGRITEVEQIRASADQRWTIVDEAFVDTAPGLSLAGEAGGRLVVLRSFGKFYGLAGVRLGFIVADEALIAQVRARLGDWPVCAEALTAGAAAYPDVDWAEATRFELAADAQRLDELLAAAGLEVVGGTSLFRLARADDPQAIFLRLASAGILCRPFEGQPLLRFGLPGRAADWDRLAAALPGDLP